MYKFKSFLWRTNYNPIINLKNVSYILKDSFVYGKTPIPTLQFVFIDGKSMDWLFKSEDERNIEYNQILGKQKD